MAIGDKKTVVMEYDRAVPGGVATLDGEGKLNAAQRPDYSIGQVIGLQDALDMKQGALTFDDEPAENSENPVKSGGVYAALTKKQPTLTGLPGQLIGIGDDGTAKATVYPSNPNLLDNWYFADPINQRGETSYGSNVYAIDRWKTWGSQISVHEDGVVLQKLEPYSSGQIYQLMEHERFGGNKQITISAIVDDKLFFTTGDIDGGGLSIAIDGTTNNLSFVYQYEENLSAFIFSFFDTNKHKIKAAKLEVGDRQTLAHQDEDGSWVLNDPPPNKALELAKCQRYQFAINPMNYAGVLLPGIGFGCIGNMAYFFIPLPVSLRAHYTVKWTGEWVLSKGNTGTTSIPVTSIETYSRTENGVMLKISTQTDLDADQAYRLLGLYPSNNSKLIIDANL